MVVGFDDCVVEMKVDVSEPFECGQMALYNDSTHTIHLQSQERSTNTQKRNTRDYCLSANLSRSSRPINSVNK